MRSWPRLLFEIIELKALEKALAEHLEKKNWYIIYIASISISTITINIASRGVEFNLNRMKYCKTFFISWNYYILIGMLAIMVKAREIVWPKDKKYKWSLSRKFLFRLWTYIKTSYFYRVKHEENQYIFNDWLQIFRYTVSLKHPSQSDSDVLFISWPTFPMYDYYMEIMEWLCSLLIEDVSLWNLIYNFREFAVLYTQVNRGVDPTSEEPLRSVFAGRKRASTPSSVKKRTQVDNKGQGVRFF